MSKVECAVGDCNLPARTRGWCNKHYQRWALRGGDPGVKLKSGRKPGTATGSGNGRWKGGNSTHELRDIYHDMIGRCHRKTHPRYKDYGGRGIKVCKEWRDDFWLFVKDVGARPEGTNTSGRAYYSLDRVNNDEGYEPGNVRWATPSEQALNKRGYGDFESRRDPKTGRFI